MFVYLRCVWLTVENHHGQFTRIDFIPHLFEDSDSVFDTDRLFTPDQHTRHNPRNLHYSHCLHVLCSTFVQSFTMSVQVILYSDD
jgi:hypothetical protein